jgi:hypothetical protein
MTDEEIQEQIEEVRLRLLEAIEELPDEALTRPGAIQDWSVRDFLFLMSAWEAELVTGLMQVKQGKKPQRLLDALANRDTYNQARLAENPERDLDLVFDDLQQAQVALEGWLAEFSQQELNNPNRYKWLSNRPLAQIVADASYAYEAAFLPAIEQYASAWLAMPDMVALDAIDVLDFGDEADEDDKSD